MAVTVGGTSITFNDATTQTTAAVNATTANVLAATAGATAGAVGTYAFLRPANTTTYAAGSTLAGSSLRYNGALNAAEAVVYITSDGTTVSGTWRCMGHRQLPQNADQASTLWLRIS